MKKLTFSIMSLSVALALSACGGGDGDKRSDAEHYAQGKFIDSAVAGVDVIQDGKSLGLTDKNGIFQYKINGGQLTFQVGKVILGHTKPKAIVTPEDLTSDTEKQTKILQVLQSLDDDLNPENGINIQITTSANLDTHMNLLADDITPLNVLQKAIPNSPHVIPAEEARAHFEKTKKELANATADKLVGYWRSDCVTEGNTSEIAFLKIKKVGDNLIQQDTKIVKKFNNDSCLGEFVYEYDNSNKNEPIHVDGSIKQNGDGSFSVSYTGENDKLFKETYRPISKDVFVSTEKQVNAEHSHSDNSDTSDNYFMGYWKSSCLADLTNLGSEFAYVRITQSTKNNIQIVERFNETFQGTNCSGKSKIYQDEKGGEQIINVNELEKYDNGFRTLDENPKDGKVVTFTKISQSDFNNIKRKKEMPVFVPERNNQEAGVGNAINGNWKSDECMINPDNANQSGYFYLKFTKVGTRQVRKEQVLESFNSPNCSGTSSREVIEDDIINLNSHGTQLDLQGNDRLRVQYEEDGQIIREYYHRIK